MSITTDEIRTRIKQIIGNVAGLNPARIPDEATLRDELKLDSLSLPSGGGLAAGARPVQVRRALITSLSADGHAAALVLGAPGGSG